MAGNDQRQGRQGRDELMEELRNFRQFYDGDVRPAAVLLIGHALIAGKSATADQMADAVNRWDALLDTVGDDGAYHDALKDGRDAAGLEAGGASFVERRDDV